MRAHPLLRQIERLDPVRRMGRVTALHSTAILADGPGVALGTVCSIETGSGAQAGSIDAEVVRIDRGEVTLSPFDDSASSFVGARVVARDHGSSVPAGDAFLGRVVDALGRPLDGRPLGGTLAVPLHGEVPAALKRETRPDVLATGIRSIDALLPLGRGQRIGIYAPAGAGKTSLMTQIARHAQADITIFCLVGERGREVETIWREISGSDRADATCLVAATSDQAPALRVRAVHQALALADYWRAQGKHVLLLLDSATRLAMAMREIGLAAGEPPTVRAYTPGVFAAMPKIVERCGALAGSGSITAVMTVLAEQEEMDDPVCEMMKSILDGHILLSRRLADSGHYPAIDIPRSISRLSGSLMSSAQLAASRKLRAWMSEYERSRAMIDAGLYVAGSNSELDQAVAMRGPIANFLRQGGDEAVQVDVACNGLLSLCGGRP